MDIFDSLVASYHSPKLTVGEILLFDMREQLCDAVNNKEIIIFQYEGLTREVKPTKVGRSTAGNDTLEAYQIGGKSKSDSIPFWRQYTVDKIRNLEVTESKFQGVPEEYERNDSRMSEIYCRI